MLIISDADSNKSVCLVNDIEKKVSYLKFISLAKIKTKKKDKKTL